jgi:hypothetical protein
MAQVTLLSFYNLVKPTSGGKLLEQKKNKENKKGPTRMALEENYGEEMEEEADDVMDDDNVREGTFQIRSLSTNGRDRNNGGEIKADESPVKDITHYFTRCDKKRSFGEKKLATATTSSKRITSPNSDILKYFKKEETRQNRNSWY